MGVNSSVQLAWARYLPCFVNRMIEVNPQLLGIVSNTGWMLGDQIVRKIVGLLIGILLARYLDPQVYGNVQLCFCVCDDRFADRHAGS